MSDAPTREELVRSARDLIPVLKERAEATEKRRDLPPETLADLKTVGLHRIFTPRRYGGFEMDWGSHVEVSRELGKGCGSTSWISSVVFCNTWLLARFPPDCQEEIWADKPDAVVATAFAGKGTMTETEGGFMVSGHWKFASGINFADCVILSAHIEDYDSKGATLPVFRFAMLLRSEYEVVDTWFAEGLKGSGSNDIKVSEQFIPAHRTLLSTDATGTSSPGAALHESYIYGVEYAPYFFTLVSGPFLGTAIGALEDYCTITKERFGQMFGESVVEQVPVQVRVGESAAEIHAANLIVDKLMASLHRIGASRKPLPATALMIIRRDLAFASRLCVSAAKRLSGMMGVTGQTASNPVQRHFRDCRTISTHGGIQWDASMQPTGQVLLGVETGDPNIDQGGDVFAL